MKQVVKPFVKVVNPGKMEIGGRLREAFVKIEYSDSGRLSLSGVVGPWHSGNCAGSAGQIQDCLKDIAVFHKHWSAKKVAALRAIWRDWHLNDMKSGCVHQDKWDVGKTLALASGENKPAGHVYPEEHPEGLLCKPCPECGHKYGSKWLKREVPIEALEFLRGLPEAAKKPAWV